MTLTRLPLRTLLARAYTSQPSILPKFTLYSGPQCSLCDDAKAELAKVRQQRPFELEIVDIHAPGQERWKKRYAWWIPALHLDGTEVAKGRWDAHAVTAALDSWTPPGPALNPHEAFMDAEPARAHELTGVLYHTLDGTLGASDITDCTRSSQASDGDRRRCFNCGSPAHAVSTCPTPRNQALIALSRQLFEFHRSATAAEGGAPFDLQALQAQGEWRAQRLAWLDDFAPGYVRGAALREALDLSTPDMPGWVSDSDVPWLQNIARWGYPPGWNAVEDPREAMRRRIAGEDLIADESASEDDFVIFGEDGEERIVINKPDSPDLAQDKDLDVLDDTAAVVDVKSVYTSSEPGDTAPSSFEPHPHPKRWARYPETWFSSDLLPVYDCAPLPPLPDSPPPSPPPPSLPPPPTSAHIIAFPRVMLGLSAPSVPVPHSSYAQEWRFPDTLSRAEMQAWSRPFDPASAFLWAPPPPPGPPPDVPPPPPPGPPPGVPPPPPPPAGTTPPLPSAPAPEIDDECDMDMSDDE